MYFGNAVIADDFAEIRGGLRLLSARTDGLYDFKFTIILSGLFVPCVLDTIQKEPRLAFTASNSDQGDQTLAVSRYFQWVGHPIFRVKVRFRRRIYCYCIDNFFDPQRPVGKCQ